MVTQDLDRKSKRVLEAMYEHGGEAKVGEIADFTGIKSQQVHYRLDEKLEPAGLVENRKIDGEGPMGVKVSKLTEDGTEVVGHVLDDGSEPTVVEQVRELRAVVEDAHDAVQNFEGRTDDVEEKIERIDDRVREAEQAAKNAERRAEEVDDLRERIEELEENPLEDVIDKKMAELRQVASRVEQVDAMNHDVRKVLRSHGVLKAVNKDLQPDDVPKSEQAMVKKATNSPVRNTPQRDGYVAGDLLKQMSKAAEARDGEQ